MLMARTFYANSQSGERGGRRAHPLRL